MKEENIKYLQNYEAEMITAFWYRYTRNLPLDTLKELDRIYKDETGKDLGTNYSCGNCILKLLSQCSRLYFKELPERIPENLVGRKKL